MHLLLKIGSYGLENNSIDWALIGSIVLKIILGFGILMFLFVLFLLVLAFLIAQSVKTGIVLNSLTLAIKKFLKGFFFLMLFFSSILLIAVAIPLLKDYPLHITIIAAVGLSATVALIAMGAVQLLFERILIKLYVFKRLSATLHKLLLLIDSYIGKRS
jgi:hypothetical protein